MNKASCLSLLSNSVLVWNCLRASGQGVNDEDLALMSPLLRYHVAPNGTYFNSKGPSSQPVLTLFDE